MYFCFFTIISPWEHLNKLESPLPKDALCQLWLKLPQWVYVEKKILKCCHCIFAIVSIWKKKPRTSVNKMNYFHIKRFCDKFGWNWSSDSWEEDENVKSLHTRTDRRTTDNMQSEKLTITLLRWANNLPTFTPIK